jgi:phospholipid/cholesterol/gamma-HCH transport system ATP-binding protein
MAAASAGQAVVDVREVWKAFDDHPVLRGISLTLEKGTTLAVMGGSGSGKTVLLRTIDGLLAPDAGEVWLLGTRIDGLREEQLLPLRRRAGYVFQGAALFDSVSVFENVAFPLREHARLSEGEITDRVHRFLSLVGLSADIDDVLPGALSGGMRKRVGVARTLVVEPEVVFFDEPTAGLDPTNAKLVAGLINELKKGVCDTSIVVTHDLEFADAVADRMAILYQGRFAEVGTPAEIHRSSNRIVRDFLAGELRER